MSPSGYRVKASVLRAYLRYLKREQLLETLMQTVSPTTAELLRQPPLPSTWLDGSIYVDVQGAVEKVQGLDGVLRMVEMSLRDALPTFMGALRHVVTVFGTSPATLYGLLGRLLTSTIQGCEYSYEPTGDRSGVVSVVYPEAKQVPARSFYTTVPTLNIVMELCSVRGQVGTPQLRGPNAATFVVRW